MKELHLICNAHLDPVWQWDWNEGATAALATFYSAVDIAEEYDYIFCHNEALLYEYVEQYDPKLFNRIKDLVKAGKWHIMGGWYVQPDCNVPSGEGFVRQMESGLKYFKEKFGVRPTVAVNFDSLCCFVYTNATQCWYNLAYCSVCIEEESVDTCRTALVESRRIIIVMIEQIPLLLVVYYGVMVCPAFSWRLLHDNAFELPWTEGTV